MKLFGDIKASKTVIVVGAVLLAIIALFVALVIYTYAYKGIFPGVSAGGISLSGKNETEAAQLIDASCKKIFADARVKVSIEDIEIFEVSADQLKVKTKSAEIAKNAMAIGHEGGFFKRTSDVLKAMFGGVSVDVSFDMDAAAREELMAKLVKYDIEPVDAIYTIEDGKTLVLHPRSDGKKMNVPVALDAISKALSEKTYKELSLSRETAPSAALDMDKVYSEVHKEVKDAYLEKGENGNKIIPHVLGIDYDLAAAKSAYDASPDEVIKIPLVITEPKIYTKHLEVNLFKYCLADVETHFSPKKVARTSNVRLAASLVNGTILNPGEEFSYNKTVGPRTAARGFKEAAIFAQGEVVDGIGGGICQVSSTIYMAAIRADMEIVERKNHSFYVDYTPKGEDATVVYGSIDFRFKNTSEYPVKIVATSKDNYIRVKIMGTEPDEKVTVKLTKKTHSTTPYTTREKTSTSLAAGQRSVEQKGQPGLSMTVYRNVYDSNGKLIKSFVENTSKYKPMPEIVLVGTAAAKPAAGTDVPAETPVETPEAPPAEEPANKVPAETPVETPEAPPAEESANEVAEETMEETAPPADVEATPETTDEVEQ